MSTKINGGTGVDKVDPTIITEMTQTITDNVTGNIVESGSNENGNYIKWADGTMICIKEIQSNVAIDTAWGGLFINATPINAGSWPLPFISVPTCNYASVGPSDTFGTLIFTSAHLKPTNVLAGTFLLMRGATGALSIITTRITAIGRWY